MTTFARPLSQAMGLQGLPISDRQFYRDAKETNQCIIRGAEHSAPASAGHPADSLAAAQRAGKQGSTDFLTRVKNALDRLAQILHLDLYELLFRQDSSQPAHNSGVA